MLLGELAEASGTSVASIKYYRREGLLPPGARVTATRADYGTRHLERLHLIAVMREVAGASIADIRQLTTVLDDEHCPLLAALGIAQALAAGLPASAQSTTVPPDEHPLVAEVLAAMSWPDRPSAPRTQLDALLRTMDAQGIQNLPAAVLRYARALGEVAREDVASISLPAADGTDQAGPSDDVLVMRAVVGMVAFDRLARILRSLGHASYSMTGAATGQEPGR